MQFCQFYAYKNYYFHKFVIYKTDTYKMPEESFENCIG
tara:strand:- start:6908 stop:7021 length:114 start_codon:yes stop_codon:yes gene_type:complete